MNGRNWERAILLSKKVRHKQQLLVMKYAPPLQSNAPAVLLNDHYSTTGNRQTVIILLLHYLRMLLERPADLNPGKS